METTSRIRRHIRHYLDDKPFSIRDFLVHGSRAAVDQAFRRLVVSGEILRVARGLYIRNTAPWPNILAVAQAKAAAFKKVIATHGSTAAHDLGLVERTSGKCLFSASGHSSSFRFGKTTIHFVGTCARKMHLLNEPVGLVIRALWHLGKPTCMIYTACSAVQLFKRSDRKKLHDSINLMPDWMRKLFPSLQSKRRYAPA